MEPLQYQKLLTFTTVILFEYCKHLDEFEVKRDGDVSLKVNTNAKDSNLVTAFTKD